MTKFLTKALGVPLAEAIDAGTTIVVPAVLAFSIGLFLVFGAGIANSSTRHNLAHDGQHAFTVPCH